MAEGSQDEVNIALGDKMSEMFDNAAQLTYENVPGAVYRSGFGFRGSRGLDGAFIGAAQIDQVILGQGFDGIGTKVEVHERMQDHHRSGHDLLAMVCDDAPRNGAQVISWGSVIDTGRLDEEDPITVKGMKDLARGMVRASKEAGVVAINGEIAELIGRVVGYGTFNYNWGAGVFTLTNKARELTPKNLEAGQLVVGLPETGPRCNGLTDIRTAFEKHHGSEWHTKVVHELGMLSLGELLSRRATIYHRLMTELTGGWDIRKEPRAHVSGFVNVTGGGQPSKLRSMLGKSGLGVDIFEPLSPPPILLYAQKLSGFDDRKAYGKWHMGPGGMVVTNEPEEVIQAAADAGIEGARVIGELTKLDKIRIRNMGAQQEEEWLEWPVAA